MEEPLYRQFYEVEKRHWWFVARQEILLRYIDTVIKLSPDARFLDVGCGTGAMLEELSKRAEAFGVDASDTAIAYCKQRGLNNVYRGNLDVVPHTQSFDCITFFDVLEHIDDEVAVLKESLALLKSAGSILITVPAYQWMWSNHDVRNHHKRRYTAPRLRKTVQQSGLRIVHCTYFNTILFPLASARRMWIKIINDHGNDLELPSRPVNALLREIFRVEKYIVPHISLPFGVSILCHAVKQ